jgi:hypothetical protein
MPRRSGGAGAGVAGRPVGETAAPMGPPARTGRQDGGRDADGGFVAVGDPVHGSDAVVPPQERPAGILRESPTDRSPT